MPHKSASIGEGLQNSLFPYRLPVMESEIGKRAITKAKRLFEKSGMTLDDLGQKMGHDAGTARRAVWQLFNKVDDPRLSTLEKLADALGVQVKDLL